jgi:hypothetical protein
VNQLSSAAGPTGALGRRLVGAALLGRGTPLGRLALELTLSLGKFLAALGG